MNKYSHSGVVLNFFNDEGMLKLFSDQYIYKRYKFPSLALEALYSLALIRS